MKEHVVITIGREYGSGGREVGYRLAEKLGIPCYDKELITKAAKESYVSEEFFNEFDEKIISTMYYFGADEYESTRLPRNAELFRIQADTIRALAEEGSCIFIGRCADIVLKENPNLVRVFLHAPKEFRKERIKARHALSDKAALDAMHKIDKQRQRYYNSFSETKWNDIAGYDLTVNTGTMSLEKAVDVIAAYVEIFKK